MIDAETGRDQTTAYLWTDGEEYEDQRCQVEVNPDEDHDGYVDFFVFIDGRGAKLQFQFSRDGALAMAEKFLRAAREPSHG